MTAGASPSPVSVLDHRFAAHASPWVALLDALQTRGAAALVIIDDVGANGSDVIDPSLERTAKSRAITELSSAGVLSVVILREGSSATPDAVTLALAGDLRWATPDAAFVGSFAGAAPLPFEGVVDAAIRRLGSSRALSLALASTPVPALTAQAWGLVDEIVPDDRLSPRIEALVATLAASPRAALAEAKALLATPDAQIASRRFAEASDRLRSQGFGEA